MESSGCYVAQVALLFCIYSCYVSGGHVFPFIRESKNKGKKYYLSSHITIEYNELSWTQYYNFSRLHYVESPADGTFKPHDIVKHKR